MERIEITITGELPERGRFATLAAAEEAAGILIQSMNDALGLELRRRSPRRHSVWFPPKTSPGALSP